MNSIDTVESQGLSIENLQTEDVKNFSEAVAKLLPQGERFVHSATGSEMILFEGTHENAVVTIQAQGGEQIQQLIVRGIDGDTAYEVYSHHTRGSGRIPQEDIDKFNKTTLDAKLRDFAYNQPTVSWSVPVSPAPPSALPELTALLNKTTLSPERQTAVVDSVVRRGTYRKSTQPHRIRANLLRLPLKSLPKSIR